METLNRNHFIDVLKGICIIFVVFTHASWTTEQNLKLLFPFWIDMAVPFFMLVSGYVYTKSFQKNEIETLDSAYNKKYLLKNLIRYTIPYLIAFLIDFCAQAILYIRNPTGIKRFLVHEIALFLQGGNGPGSYYYPEMIQIMFLFPIIYVLVRKYNLKGVLTVAFATFFLEVLKFPYMENEGQYRLLLFRYFMLLAFGSYFAMNKMNRKNWILLFVGFCFIILFRYTNYKPKIFKWWTGTSMFPVLFIIPIFGFLVEKNIRFAPLEKVGKASYNIFLTQMVYYCYLYWKIKGIFANVYLNALVSIVICVIIGIVFYEIENRITKAITEKVIEKA